MKEETRKNTNNFLILMGKKDKYYKQLSSLIDKSKKKHQNICYVCLSKPSSEIKEILRKEEVDFDNFIFIDIFKERDYLLEEKTNQILVKDPEDMEEVSQAIKNCVTVKNCSLIIMDTISTMLIYQQTDSIVKFTHNLLSDKSEKDTEKIYLMIEEEKGVYEDENKKLINDLYLFADKVVNIKQNAS